MSSFLPTDTVLALHCGQIEGPRFLPGTLVGMRGITAVRRAHKETSHAANDSFLLLERSVTAVTGDGTNTCYVPLKKGCPGYK